MARLQPRRAAAASVIGTTIEYYDFFIYATAAAIVFKKVFFPALGGLAGTLVALSTFAVGFVVRPLGGVVFGHLGDRMGRKPVLVLTLVLMGGATLLIGLLPDYTAIGVAAPVLLILLRVVQGFAMGGELGGAVLMTMEHAPEQRRGFFGSFVQVGGPLGLVLATAAFLPVAALPEEAFLAWGWRIPFLVSVVLIVTGYALRRSVDESPAFEQEVRGRADRSPALTILRRHPVETLLVAGSTISGGVAFYMMSVFGLSYGTAQLGLPRSTMLVVVMTAMIACCVLVVITGSLSDRTGRPVMMVIASVGKIALSLPFLWFLQTGEPGWMLLGYLLLTATHSAGQGVSGVFFAETFPAAVRYSGLSIGYTVGMIAGSAVAPMIAAALEASAGLPAVGVYMVATGVLTLGCVLGLIRIGRRNRDRVSLAPATT
ncbi:MHS family MFS transporter [Pseudonocardia sp. C8]|uniref:MFS transporter n=1 Tax=Pseudonocardia sp. C8 TaxID=2762759 RepID=UPI00164308ED|nr:MFS transporter [Pseudonocardia sp. C8]MBC3191103.1 MHS family MFS transporter [Pseudonocardia sp. C8]